MMKFASALLGVTLLFGAATAAYSADDHGKDHKDDKKHKEEKKKGH